MRHPQVPGLLSGWSHPLLTDLRHGSLLNRYHARSTAELHSLLNRYHARSTAELHSRHMENLRMQREDKLSDLRGSLERKPLVEIFTEGKIVVQEKIVIEERIVEVYVEKAAAAPGPRFQRGQSVHQWWAPWMDGAKETPSGSRKKSRPSWFSSEVFAGTAVSPSMPDAGSNFRSPACQLAC